MHGAVQTLLSVLIPLPCLRTVRCLRAPVTTIEQNSRHWRTCGDRLLSESIWSGSAASAGHARHEEPVSWHGRQDTSGEKEAEPLIRATAGSNRRMWLFRNERSVGSAAPSEPGSGEPVMAPLMLTRTFGCAALWRSDGVQIPLLGRDTVPRSSRGSSTLRGGTDSMVVTKPPALWRSALRIPSMAVKTNANSPRSSRDARIVRRSAPRAPAAAADQTARNMRLIV